MIPSRPQYAPVTYPVQHAHQQHYQAAAAQPSVARPIHFATTYQTYQQPAIPYQQPYQQTHPAQPAPQLHYDQAYGQAQQLMVPQAQAIDHYVSRETQAPPRCPPRYEPLHAGAFADDLPLSYEMHDAMHYEMQDAAHEAHNARYDAMDEYDAYPVASQTENGGQFLDLLESLEARVELMSQMQQTRVAIQERARVIAMMDQEVEYEPEAIDDYDYLTQHDETHPEGSYENNVLMHQYLDQQDHIHRLTNEVETMRRHMMALGQGDAAGCAGSSVNNAVSALQTQAVPDPMPSSGGAAKPDLPFVMSPFCSLSCGANVALSGDGYIASRTQGCRQSVCMGSAPIGRQADGYFFEVIVRETVEGWVGGLGIGVTRTRPGTMRRVPDKAWRVPSSFVVGYWGCTFLDGSEHTCSWNADSLEAGARVGLLVTDDGRSDMIIFVNGVPVAHVDGALSSDGGVGAEPLYPILDVFSATRQVELAREPVPPPRPWRLKAVELAPAAG